MNTSSQCWSSCRLHDSAIRTKHLNRKSKSNQKVLTAQIAKLFVGLISVHKKNRELIIFWHSCAWQAFETDVSLNKMSFCRTFYFVLETFVKDCIWQLWHFTKSQRQFCNSTSSQVFLLIFSYNRSWQPTLPELTNKLYSLKHKECNFETTCNCSLTHSLMLPLIRNKNKTCRQ